MGNNPFSTNHKLNTKPASPSRRQFLSTLMELGLGAAVLPILPNTNLLLMRSEQSSLEGARLGAMGDKKQGVAVPPSMMLHARSAHLKLLPQLVKKLQKHNFQSITYKDLAAATLQGKPLPANPVILTFDDITCAVSSQNHSFPVFEKMEKILADSGFTGVFGLITEPVLPGMPKIIQDMDKWAKLSQWVQHGMEIATHTKNHRNLVNKAYTLAEIREQIQDSEILITEALGQPVTTLILPYGDGLTGTPDAVSHEKIRPEIKQVCREVGIHFVVGIAEGRGILGLDNSSDEDTIWYMGRTIPGPTDALSTSESAFYNLSHFKQGFSINTSME